ncbi:hypothetical protein PDL71_10675 [Lacibacter sp. MH-610]|jgi:hypothetical protein|uniref:hypothetical protein n=1 Tax=Chitinophagaceae TaxID=563835 RepID=UPI001AC93F26|nr:hypothetical protein [Chitinophagales bacterium]
MITIDNYFNKVNSLDLKSLPEALRKGHEFILKATSNGSSWVSYHSSEPIKKTVDMYLAKLNEFVSNTSKAQKKQAKKEGERKQHDEVIKETMRRQGITKPTKSKKSDEDMPAEDGPQLVERIPEELRFIRRFVNLNGKTKTKDDLLRFINGLQKAILEKRIRKTSPYAVQVKYIQDSLVKTFNTMKAKIKLEVNAKTLKEFTDLLGGEKIYPSIQLLKKYINLNGKAGMKEKAIKLVKQMETAAKKRKVRKGDMYEAPLQQAYKNLREFISDKKQKTLLIEQRELNGIEGVLGCACNPLNGFEEMPAIMNSMDFANMQFETIGLKGKWFDLIGDPSSNFTAMVFGKPKMGKSYLCIDFAGYLARNHGKVLYVAKEEGLDMTLQKKLNDKDVAHPNLFVAAVLPEGLSPYDFIFLDSVNRLGLLPEDLNRLKAFNPTKSFIYIFQSTKFGNFKGSQSFQHDVDVVIEVPEKGKAVQMGRFNQGGEIDIFND